MVAAALLVATGCGYNAIQTYDEQVNAAASQIKVQLQRRADLIPNLVETVRGYAKQEQTVFTAVAEARAKLAGAVQSGNLQQMAEANAQLTAPLGRLLAIAENYPQLKSNENFRALQDQLEGTENRIAVARQDSNDAGPAGKHAGGAAPRAPSQTSAGRVSVHDRVGHDVLYRVYRFVVHPDLVVQMRARGQSGRADERDLLPTLHALTADRENLGAVGVAGHEAEAMIDRDHVAVSLFPLDVGDHAGGGRLDLGAHRGAHVDPLVRAREVENRVHTFAHEGARQPALGWHDRRRGRKPLALAGEGLVRFVERSHEEVGAARQRVHVEARRECLLAVRAERRETVPLGPGTGRPADPRILDAGVGGRKPREEPQLLLTLAEAVQRVAQAGHPLAHPLNLVGEDAVFVLERTAAGDVHPARDGGDAEHQERQHNHAADPDQGLDGRLRHLNGTGRPRAVRHQHDGPASLRLLTHRAPDDLP